MDRYMENQKEREKDNAFMRYTHISVDLVEKDHALTSMEIFPEGLNPFGMVHGGLLDTMLDNAAGSAVHTDGRSYVTQTCTLHFLRNRGEGKLIGEGWVDPPGAGYCPCKGGAAGRGRGRAGLGGVHLFLRDQIKGSPRPLCGRGLSLSKKPSRREFRHPQVAE